MNHLAHFVLAPDDDQGRTGTWLGDFVRGSDLSTWPPAIEQAIRLHRRIDSFTDTHVLMLEARRGLPAPLRRYAGILLDVYFDHLLIQHWPRWHARPLKEYVDSVHACLARIAPGLPEPAGSIAHGMATNDGLTACASKAGMARVLARIGKRLSRPVALDQALPAVLDAHAALDSAFERFFPLLQAEGARYLATSSLSTRPPELSVSR